LPTVLITGASRGFGRELVDVYATAGWVVFPLVRRPADADDLISIHAPLCHPIIGDVGRDDATEAISRTLDKHTSSLDVLINNAGNIKKNRGIMLAESDDMIDHFNIHCIGALRCTQAALPFLKKAPKPVVVNISSRWGSISRTVSGQGGLIYAYQIAKCAQNMLSACLSQELQPQNIRVYAIQPGRLKTSVAAADADTDPKAAARRLFEWIERADDHPQFAFYDLMIGTTIDW
jgi:NAD(P)-dependent dehydrogenase (short-subunit alcohol dehydrogenase family)